MKTSNCNLVKGPAIARQVKFSHSLAITHIGFDDFHHYRIKEHSIFVLYTPFIDFLVRIEL